MKRNIKSSEDKISLSDLFSSIHAVLLVQDASEITIDTSDQNEIFSAYTDSDLMDLSDLVL